MLHLVSVFHFNLTGRDYSSQQYTAFFATGKTSAQVAVTVFDDNVTEGGENFTAVLNISEYSEFLGVRRSRNGSTAIVYIEDNGESVCSLLTVVYTTHC